MKYSAFAAVLLALGAVLPANAATQVVAGNGMTLTDAARIKFNRDTRSDDQQAMVAPVTPSGDYSRLAASFGMDPREAQGLSLERVFVAKINHGKGASELQLEKDSSVGMATRSPYRAVDRSQLAASAGLDADAAAAMSIREIAAAKFDRDGTSNH